MKFIRALCLVVVHKAGARGGGYLGQIHARDETEPLLLEKSPLPLPLIAVRGKGEAGQTASAPVPLGLSGFLYLLCLVGVGGWA